MTVHFQRRHKCSWGEAELFGREAPSRPSRSASSPAMHAFPNFFSIYERTYIYIEKKGG